jgi:aminopeptidase-like protein
MKKVETIIAEPAISNIKSSDTLGKQMHAMMEELYPLCRSITGAGTIQTLNIIKKHIPLTIHKIPTGIRAFDWTVPKEWNIRDAYIKDAQGNKVVDFADSNLHVLNYSIPVHKQVTLHELRQHVHTLPEHPDWIPYRTSYYKEDWGFCMSFNAFEQLEEELYEVCIDSTLKDGHLAYGELLIKGDTHEEVLISTHICHPSLCNDNLSGICVTTFLAKEIMQRRNRFSYRFIFIPGTIGAITWLSINDMKVSRIKHGLVAALLGMTGKFNYKKSRQGDAEIDQVVEEVLKASGEEFNITDFIPYGYDERQFCSPGFNLPVGSLTRTPYAQYPEYHTSADNLEFVKPEALESSLTMYREVIRVLELNRKYTNINPKCEPNLGRRGLYSLVGNTAEHKDRQLAILWVLNLCDGRHSLLDICRRSGFSFEVISHAAEKLVQCKLLVEM